MGPPHANYWGRCTSCTFAWKKTTKPIFWSRVPIPILYIVHKSPMSYRGFKKINNEKTQLVKFSKRSTITKMFHYQGIFPMQRSMGGFQRPVTWSAEQVLLCKAGSPDEERLQKTSATKRNWIKQLNFWKEEMRKCVSDHFCKTIFAWKPSCPTPPLIFTSLAISRFTSPRASFVASGYFPWNRSNFWVIPGLEIKCVVPGRPLLI